MGGTFVRGNIQARRTPSDNVTIDTTHTTGGLIRSLGVRPFIEIENADLDDVIAALQEVRGDWQPTIGDAVEAWNVARAGQQGTVARNQGGRLPWVVRWPDGTDTGYAAHEIRPWRPRTPLERFGEVARKMEAVAADGAQRPSATFRAIAGDAQPDLIAATGRWRVYFNKHGRSDLPWCVAPEGGGWELAVPTILITTEAETVYRPKATPDDEDGRPSAWISVEGRLIVTGGRASISATSEPEVQQP